MFKVHKMESKSSDWKLLSLTNAAGDLVEEVSINRAGKDGTLFPDFDDVAVGSTLEGKMWQSPKGKMYLFPPKDSPNKDSSPAARESSGGSAEIKNILQLQVMPELTKNNAGIQKVEFLIKALGDRMGKMIRSPGEDEEEMPPF